MNGIQEVVGSTPIGSTSYKSLAEKQLTPPAEAAFGVGCIGCNADQFSLEQTERILLAPLQPGNLTLRQKHVTVDARQIRRTSTTEEKSMKANPGGLVSPQNVIGRERFIERLWATLSQVGVIMVSERRMGKTSIINKMAAEVPQDSLVLFSDVEGVSRAHEFVETLISDMHSYQNTATKTATHVKTFWESIGGTEIGGVLRLPQAAVPHWKTHLAKVLNNFVKHQDRRVVFIWDELPWMLQKIVRAEGQAAVVDLLDVLRAQR